MRKADMARAFWRSASGLATETLHAESSSRRHDRMAMKLKATMEDPAMSSQLGRDLS